MKTLKAYDEIYGLAPSLLDKVKLRPYLGMSSGSDTESDEEKKKTKTFFGRGK